MKPEPPHVQVWTVDGKQNVSLLDVGYSTAGIDEGWEGCGQGVNGTQHDAQGNPVVNNKFPDIPGLVKYGHSAVCTAGIEPLDSQITRNPLIASLSPVVCRGSRWDGTRTAAPAASVTR